MHSVPLVTISQGKIGYVFARDGKALAPSQTLASNAVADNFEDVRAFLQASGQKGPQRTEKVATQVMARFAEAVEHGHIDIVPKVMVGGTGEGKDGAFGGNMLGALMAMMLSSKAGIEPMGDPGQGPR